MPCHAFCQLWPYFSLLKNASRLGWAQIFVFGTGTSVRTLIPCQWWPNAHTLYMSVWCRFIWSLFILLRSCSKSLICRVIAVIFYVIFFFETYTVWARMSTNSPSKTGFRLIEKSDQGTKKVSFTACHSGKL